MDTNFCTFFLIKKLKESTPLFVASIHIVKVQWTETGPEEKIIPGVIITIIVPTTDK